MKDNENRIPADQVRVMLVDDNELVAKSIKRLYCNEYEITTAISAKEGLKLLATTESQFDIIVSDISMPDMDGMEFFYRIEEAFPELVERVIFMSGGATTVAQEQFLSKHRCRQLNKPFQPAELRQIISAILLKV